MPHRYFPLQGYKDRRIARYGMVFIWLVELWIMVIICQLMEVEYLFLFLMVLRFLRRFLRKIITDCLTGSLNHLLEMQFLIGCLNHPKCQNYLICSHLLLFLCLCLLDHIDLLFNIILICISLVCCLFRWLCIDGSL